uniref:Uncharacterized protein n=2 Tax=Acrobeloides nanus TaxID=290746 RepID=A0A914DSW6_9BILA
MLKGAKEEVDSEDVKTGIDDDELGWMYGSAREERNKREKGTASEEGGQQPRKASEEREQREERNQELLNVFARKRKFSKRVTPVQSECDTQIETERPAIIRQEVAAPIEQEAQNGEQRPAIIGQEAPAQNGEQRPAIIGQEAPAQNGEQRPTNAQNS